MGSNAKIPASRTALTARTAPHLSSRSVTPLRIGAENLAWSHVLWLRTSVGSTELYFHVAAARVVDGSLRDSGAPPHGLRSLPRTPCDDVGRVIQPVGERLPIDGLAVAKDAEQVATALEEE